MPAKKRPAEEAQPKPPRVAKARAKSGPAEAGASGSVAAAGSGLAQDDKADSINEAYLLKVEAAVTTIKSAIPDIHKMKALKISEGGFMVP